MPRRSRHLIGSRQWEQITMTDSDREAKLLEFDHLMNDDDAPYEPSILWGLLADLVALDAMTPPRNTRRGTP